MGSFRCQRDSSCGTGYELTEHNDCKGETPPSPPGRAGGGGEVGGPELSEEECAALPAGWGNDSQGPLGLCEKAQNVII